MTKRGLALAPAFLVLLQGLWIGPRYDRYVLPAFDGFVYDAMADNPRVFTVAPWGYRILAPWIVHFLPASSAAAGFFWLNLVLLSGAVFLVGWWLRRIGFSPLGSALGGLTLALTPPLRAVLDYQVLVDPLALLITVLILHAMVTPHAPSLAALFALGALTKEVCLLPLAVAPFVLASRVGWKRSARPLAIIATPAITLLCLLHMTWGEESQQRTLNLLGSAPERAALIPFGFAVMTAAATILILLGAVRERSMELRAIGILLWCFSLLAVVLNPYGFIPADLLRIWLFAWAPALPLALTGAGFRRTSSVLFPSAPARWRNAASTVTVLACLGLAMSTDSYRRAPSGDSPNPIIMLARFRETLKTAAALENGENFAFDARSGRFAGPVTEPFNLTEGRQHRWFLFQGFGPEAPFESGVPVFQGEARLLVPILTPADAALKVELQGGQGVQVSVGGQEIGSAMADGSSTSLTIPAALLFRGDNMVGLRGPDGVAIGVRRFEVRVASKASPR